jgi:drug/metabolite transporter (DMT)-like permease
MSRLAWRTAFSLMAIIWGCSFWWVEVALEGASPLQIAFLRAAIGGAVLGALVAVTRSPWPTRSQWKAIAVVALLLNVVSVTLFAMGQTQITSVLAGVINATTPLWAVAVTLIAYSDDRPTRRQLAGLVVGFLGVLIVLGVWQSAPSQQWWGIGACLAAALSYGIALPYAQRRVTPTDTSPLSLAAGQVLLGAAFLMPLVAIEAAWRGIAVAPPATAPILALLALGGLASGVAYVLNLVVIRAAGSATAASVTYVIPLVAILVGVLILGESLSWYQPVGAAVVLLGIAVIQARPRHVGTQQP